jgi:hypothetical protein
VKLLAGGTAFVVLEAYDSLTDYMEYVQAGFEIFPLSNSEGLSMKVLLLCA